MKRFGFTLIELLVVVIVVGILAVAALPSFSRGAERAKVKDAQSVLAAIYSAERVYYLDWNTYGTVANLTASNYLSSLNSDDWTYTVPLEAGGLTFTATATRADAGPNPNTTITVNNTFDGVSYQGTHPDRDQ